MPTSELVTRAKATVVEKGKGKATNATPDPTLIARFPSTGTAGLNDAIKGLAKDSELLKSAKEAHSKEESFAKAIEALRSAREDSLNAFKESKDFYEEAMAHASMHAQTIMDQWLEDEVGRKYLLDLGEAGYDMGYQDA
nr:uncharacterized protein LOC109176331 [Ipomoea batatas]